MRFYIGAQNPGWLEIPGMPLMVSRRRIFRSPAPDYKARTDWVLDSGGFTELSLHGEWLTSIKRYVYEVRHCRDVIGRLRWAASMDFMCEPWILRKTGMTVREHQRRTIDNYLRLKQYDLPIMPVLQGYAFGEHLAHMEMYARRGVDLRKEPIVGVGSICRRQGMGIVRAILRSLHDAGVKLHAFGLKTLALQQGAGRYLSSSDSMAWCFRARYAGLNTWDRTIAVRWYNQIRRML